jgi:hypothetical protein
MPTGEVRKMETILWLSTFTGFPENWQTTQHISTVPHTQLTVQEQVEESEERAFQSLLCQKRQLERAMELAHVVGGSCLLLPSYHAVLAEIERAELSTDLL